MYDVDVVCMEILGKIWWFCDKIFKVIGGCGVWKKYIYKLKWKKNWYVYDIGLDGIIVIGFWEC